MYVSQVSPTPCPNTFCLCHVISRRVSTAASVGSAQQTDSPSSLPTEHVTSDEGRADAPTESEPVQGVAAQTHVDGTTAVARTGGDEPATAVAEPASETQPQTPLAPILRRATEGSKGADDRSSHLMGCAYCEETLPVGASIGWCERCPRSFCPRCLERGLGDQGVHIEELGRGCRALLRGERGDFLIAQCPLCVCGGDKGFAPPPQGALAMDHLLAELLRHDLSICFRESVDIVEHPDYLESIGRQNMMDLGTMLGKLKNRRYPRRRGPGQFLDDLNRIWRNCRKYAGCDELGQPYCGTTVPGIVRCALTLEAMSIRFCATHMSDQTWQVRTNPGLASTAKVENSSLNAINTPYGIRSVDTSFLPFILCNFHFGSVPVELVWHPFPPAVCRDSYELRLQASGLVLGIPGLMRSRQVFVKHWVALGECYT